LQLLTLHLGGIKERRRVKGRQILIIKSSYTDQVLIGYRENIPKNNPTWPLTED
jgi:hypothetical protein